MKNKHILTPGWGKAGHTFTPPHLDVSANSLAPTVSSELGGSMVKVHFWICRNGYATTVGTDRLSKKEKKLNYKYLGYSFDQGWPKKMNTGRIIFAFTPKKRKGSMDSGSIKLIPNDKT